MPKIFRLAILANTSDSARTNSAVRTIEITASSHSEARELADKIGAAVFGWRLAA